MLSKMSERRSVRWLIAGFLSCLVFSGCKTTPKPTPLTVNQTPRKPKGVEEEHVTTIEISVSDMSCKNCSSTVEKLLRGLAGVKKANVNFEKGLATVVVSDPNLTADKICDEIEAIGFGAKVASRE